MGNKAGLPSEGLAAHVADIRFLSRVSSYVGIEITFLSERLTTNVAFKRFLPCVHTYMSYKEALYRETLFTFVT